MKNNYKTQTQYVAAALDAKDIVEFDQRVVVPYHDYQDVSCTKALVYCIKCSGGVGEGNFSCVQKKKDVCWPSFDDAVVGCSIVLFLVSWIVALVPERTGVGLLQRLKRLHS